MQTLSESDTRVEALAAERVLLLDSNERGRARDAELSQKIMELENLLEVKNETIKQHVKNLTRINGYINEQHAPESIEERKPTPVLHSSIEDVEISEANLRKELQDSALALAREKELVSSALQEVTLVKSEIASLRTELNQRPTVEELQNARRQTRLFQRIAFNEQSDSDSSDHEKDVKTKGYEDDDVDELLLSRIKQLEAQLREARIVEQELIAQNNKATEHAASAEVHATESAKLVTRLENELEQRTKGTAIINTGSENAECNSSGDTYNHINYNSETIRQLKATGDQGLSELLGLAGDRSASIKNSSETSFNIRHDAENSSQMAVILQGQRDRYKERLATVEMSLTQAQQRLFSEQDKYQNLQSDNVALYGKVRYLQTQLGSSTQWGHSPGKDIEIGYDAEKRYVSAYEEQLNPFQEFTETERKRHVSSLGVGDRIVYSTLRTFISTPAGRASMLGYFGVMHILTFFALFFLVSHVDHGCDLAIDHIAHLA